MPPYGPYLIDVMSVRQKVKFSFLVVLWMAALYWYWSWWTDPSHIVTIFGMVVASIMLMWTTILPGWFFLFALQMKRPNPSLPLPKGRAAMVVTKAPTEPWFVVRATLEAMLDQDFPTSPDGSKGYDVWLADEDPTAEVIQWCDLNDVRISCRKGVPGYQNKVFPGREKCKEGNLRFFYDRFGYALYDFVVQMDADHVPSRTYLREMIRPFIDPTVGYVAAPSVCDSNITESWAVRGRLWVEGSLHGPLQAGYNNGWSPNPIGSHYAVRTKALATLQHRLGRQVYIGGLGPELAEDHSTGLAFNATGWRGVFAMNALASGEGPPSFTDAMIQEFQWSRSLTNVLLRWTPGYWSGLTPGMKLQYGFAQMWYPIFGLHMLTCYLMPLAALYFKTPWVNVDYPEHLMRMSVLTLACLLPVQWLRLQGWFRPSYAKVLGWEAVLFQFVRWPWIFFACVHSVLGYFLNKEFQFRVTPKMVNGPKPLTLAVLTPYLLIVLVSAGAAVWIDNPETAKGYYFFALLNAFTYTVVLIVLGGLHIHENKHHLDLALPPFISRPLLQSLLAVCVLVFASTLRGPDVVTMYLPAFAESVSATELAISRASGDTTAQRVHAYVSLVSASLEANEVGLMNRPTASPLVDLPTDTMFFGVYDPSSTFAGNSKVTVEQVFIPWRLNDVREIRTEVKRILRQNRVPQVTLEPWPFQINGLEKESLFEDIVRGKYDSSIWRTCEYLGSESPQPILIRWAHEMELLGQFPWSQDDPAAFIRAYRYFVSKCRESAPNVRFVWSPAGDTNRLGSFWPGADVVDYVGLTALSYYEKDVAGGHPNGMSFPDVFDPRYQAVAGFGKPVIVAELGVSGDDTHKKQWLKTTFGDFGRYPLLTGAIYFNDKNPHPWPGFDSPHNPPDWRITPDIFPPSD